jgi:hypothetical protein
VLCFLLSGKAARDAEAVTALLQGRGQLPPEAIELCRTLMADKPADRPPTMNAVIERLNEVARGIIEGEKARRTPPPVPPPIDDKKIDDKKIGDKKIEPGKAEKTDDKSAEKPAAQSAESLPAIKKPPVARSLDDEGVPPIIVGDEPRPVVDPEPIGQIVIKTKGRGGKKPAAKPEAKPEPQTDEAKSEATAEAPAATTPNSPPPTARPKEKPAAKRDPAAKNSLAAKDGLAGKTPLLVAGAIGGGGVLALGLLIAVVWYFAFGRSSKTVATVAPAASATPAGGNASPAADAESNPIAPDTEQNPVPAMLVENADQQAAAGTESKASPLPGSEPAAALVPSPPAPPAAEEDSAKPEPSSQPKAAESQKSTTEQSKAEKSATGKSKAEKPKADEPKPAEPMPPMKKAAPKPTAPKPTASKQAAKAAPKIEPFKDFEVAVDLPQLPEMAGQSPGDALTAIALGPCKVAENAPLLVILHGGETAIRTPRQKFELQGKPGGRAWDVLMSAGSPPAVVATLAVEQQKLMFQWTGEALKQAATAQQLANCALELTSEKHQHLVALRLPVLGEPLTVEIDKAGANAKWLMGNLPAAKSTFLEVTRAEGFKPAKLEPKEPINPGTSAIILVWLGPKDKPPPLALKLTSTANARGVTVNMQPQVKLEGLGDLQPYRRKEIVNLQPRAAQQLQMDMAALTKAKNDRPSKDPVKAAMEKPLMEKLKTDLTAQVESRTTLLDQLAFLADFTESTAGNARLHFRVYHQASDKVQVDLLVTENGSEPEPEPKK